MKLTAKLTIKGETFEVSTDSPNATEQSLSNDLKEYIFQHIHEQNLDSCKGYLWAEKQAHKLQAQLDKAIVSFTINQ
jgi:hypothetical protein